MDALNMQMDAIMLILDSFHPRQYQYFNIKLTSNIKIHYVFLITIITDDFNNLNINKRAILVRKTTKSKQTTILFSKPQLQVQTTYSVNSR